MKPATEQPRRPHASDEPDAETVIRDRLKTYEEEKKKSEDWKKEVLPALLKRHPQP